MGTFFIGCLHLGHEGMARHRGFNDSWEHDLHLEKCWNSVVSKRDKVFILGDITMENSKHYYKLDLLNGYKEVILGNHDRPQDIVELLNHVDKIAGAVKYKGYLLTHVPIHPNEVVFCKGNIHAHIHHENSLEDCIVSDRYQEDNPIMVHTVEKYFNVDAKLLGFTPKSFYEISGQGE